MSETAQPRNPFSASETASSYDGWFDTPMGAAVDRLEMALMLRMATPMAGERALDVGTGTGHVACELAARGLTVTGVDSSEAMLDVARAKPQRVRWLHGVAEALPFPDGSFDLVTCLTALEFVADVDLALAEMCRVVSPGGRVVVGAINPHSAWGQAYIEGAKAADTPFRHARFMTPSDVVARLSVHGAVRWSSSVFFGPAGGGWRHADLLERLGRLFARSKGALVVARVDR